MFRKKSIDLEVRIGGLAEVSLTAVDESVDHDDTELLRPYQQRLDRLAGVSKLLSKLL